MSIYAALTGLKALPLIRLATASHPKTTRQLQKATNSDTFAQNSQPTVHRNGETLPLNLFHQNIHRRVQLRVVAREELLR